MLLQTRSIRLIPEGKGIQDMNFHHESLAHHIRGVAQSEVEIVILGSSARVMKIVNRRNLLVVDTTGTSR